MKTIRRDKLLRMAKAGRLVMIESYHFDDMHGASETKIELPVRFSEDHGDWLDGWCNVRAYEFKSSSGAAWENPNGTITLHVHSNHSVDFRVLAAGEKMPEPIRQDDPRRKVGAL